MTDNKAKKPEERRLASLQKLAAKNVPSIEDLPVIEPEEEAQIRSKKEVLQRVLCLCFLAAKAEGTPDEIIQNLVSDYQVGDAFSPNEQQFMASQTPDEQDVINALWRYESAWVMLWALGYIKELSYPDTIADVPLLVKTINSQSLQDFINGVNMRNASEILDENDLIYRYHWAVRNAQLKGEPAPSNLDSSVVMERHYALNWLSGYGEADWDDVDTST